MTETLELSNSSLHLSGSAAINKRFRLVHPSEEHQPIGNFVSLWRQDMASCLSRQYQWHPDVLTNVGFCRFCGVLADVYVQIKLCNDTFWHRLDGLMPEGVEISNYSFAFTRPLDRNDSGVYRCEVKNDLGLRSQDVTLWVQGMLLRFLNRAEIMLKPKLQLAAQHSHFQRH